MKILKTLLLLTPFNVLAHPGHADLTAGITTADFLLTILAVSAVLFPVLFVLYKRQQKD